MRKIKAKKNEGEGKRERMKSWKEQRTKEFTGTERMSRRKKKEERHKIRR